MIRIVRVPYVEDDRGLGIEAFDLLIPEIGFDVKGEAIDPRGQHGALGQDLLDSSVPVRQGPADLPPAAFFTDFQHDGHAARRTPPRDVQNVSGDAAHDSSFSSRRWVIFRCSSAAMRSSASGSLGRRSRSRARISAAVLPVAQTMKM